MSDASIMKSSSGRKLPLFTAALVAFAIALLALVWWQIERAFGINHLVARMDKEEAEATIRNLLMAAPDLQIKIHELPGEGWRSSLICRDKPYLSRLAGKLRFVGENRGGPNRSVSVSTAEF